MFVNRDHRMCCNCEEYKIIIVGLANAGKTTILYKMHLGEVVNAHPTIGSNVEEVRHNNTRL